MLMGIPWYVLAVGGVLLLGLFAIARRKAEDNASYGQAGAQAVKLGRLY